MLPQACFKELNLIDQQYIRNTRMRSLSHSMANHMTCLYTSIRLIQQLIQPCIGTCIIHWAQKSPCLGAGPCSDLAVRQGHQSPWHRWGAKFHKKGRHRVMWRFEREKIHMSLEIQEATEEQALHDGKGILGRRNGMEVGIKDYWMAFLPGSWRKYNQPARKTEGHIKAGSVSLDICL